MNLRRSSALILPLGMITMAQSASAQVIIDFNKVSGAPFSPWAMAALGILVVLAGLFFIKRKAGYGAFSLMLAGSLVVTAVIQEQDGHAIPITPTPVALTTSGALISQHTIAGSSISGTCGPVGYVWVTSGVGNIAITDIRYDTGYQAFDPNNPPGSTFPSPLPTAPAPVCNIGTQLNGSTSCVVWYLQPGPCVG